MSLKQLKWLLTSSDINNIVSKDEELNQENFEDLVAEFSKQFIDNNINVSTEDLVKFVSIVNIDKLSDRYIFFFSMLVLFENVKKPCLYSIQLVLEYCFMI